MGSCCSCDDHDSNRTDNDESASPSLRSRRRTILPEIINLDEPIRERDLRKWDAEDCDAYARDEQLFEEELEFSKQDILMGFHSQLNTFMSLLKQKIEENENAPLQDTTTRENDDSEEAESDESGAVKSTTTLSVNQSRAATQKSRHSHSFHINTQESLMEQQLIDIRKLQRMFTVATAFGRFSDARLIHKHFVENVKNKVVIDDAEKDNNINNNNSSSSFEDTHHQMSPNIIKTTSSNSSSSLLSPIIKMGDPIFTNASGDDEQNARGGEAITLKKRNIVNDKKFDVDLPLKPFFPYNGRVQQWSALQWALAIQTQRHLNEFFHDKSERLSYLDKDRGDFVLLQMTREEQNKCVTDFVRFLLHECKADVNCEATRREYERDGRLKRQQQNRRVPAKTMTTNEKNNRSDNKQNIENNINNREPFSPPAVAGAVAGAGEPLHRKSSKSSIITPIDSRYDDLQHDAQDYCHRDHPLFLAVDSVNDLAFVELCRFTHCVVNPFNKTKDTPLSTFCDNFRLTNRESLKRASTIIRTLVDSCANVNNENADDSTTSFTSVRTPLDFATLHGSVDICALLVQLGADWQRTHKKLTSLMQDFVKWNYGSRDQVEKMRLFYESLVANNGLVAVNGGETEDSNAYSSPSSWKRPSLLSIGNDDTNEKNQVDDEKSRNVDNMTSP